MVGLPYLSCFSFKSRDIHHKAPSVRDAFDCGALTSLIAAALAAPPLPYLRIAIRTAASAVIRVLLSVSQRGPEFNWANSLIAFLPLTPGCSLSAVKRDFSAS